jgi:hypothetical protein
MEVSGNYPFPGAASAASFHHTPLGFQGKPCRITGPARNCTAPGAKTKAVRLDGSSKRFSCNSERTTGSPRLLRGEQIPKKKMRLKIRRELASNVAVRSGESAKT